MGQLASRRRRRKKGLVVADQVEDSSRSSIGSDGTVGSPGSSVREGDHRDDFYHQESPHNGPGRHWSSRQGSRLHDPPLSPPPAKPTSRGLGVVDYPGSEAPPPMRKNEEPHGALNFQQAPAPTAVVRSRGIPQQQQEACPQQNGFGRAVSRRPHPAVFSTARAVLAVHAHRYPDLPPPPVHPRFRCSRCTGTRKALCIGVNYTGQKGALHGCTNDAKSARDFLIRYAGFQSKDVMLLTDDPERPPSNLPTRETMFEGMRWLVSGAKPDDSLFFHYSGHGGQIVDTTGQEDDGYNEVIFPVDYRKNGCIVDDELHRELVTPLPEGCRLMAVFDSCHSGTALDLPCIYTATGHLDPSCASRRSRARDSSPADVIAYTACQDKETTADTVQGGNAVGAMSYALLQCLSNQYHSLSRTISEFTSESFLEANPRQTHTELLDSLRDILGRKYNQKPQLSSSHPMDMNERFTIGGGI